MPLDPKLLDFLALYFDGPGPDDVYLLGGYNSTLPLIFPLKEKFTFALETAMPYFCIYSIKDSIPIFILLPKPSTMKKRDPPTIIT
jgi:hypothetical protein